MLYILASLLFGTVLSQPNGEGGEDNQDGGGGDYGGEDGTDSDYDDYCSYADDMSECVAGGYNGTCVWGISNDTDADCGQCGSVTDGNGAITCEQFMTNYGDLLSAYSLYCEYDDSVFDELCESTTTPEPTYPDNDGGGGEDSKDSTDNTWTDDYDCSNDWEDTTDCDEYSVWSGTIVATTTSHAFRWLCFVCDWDGAFELVMPDAVISIDIETDCYTDDSTTITDTTTVTDNDGESTDNDGSGEGTDNGGSGEDSGNDGEGGENKRRLFEKRRLQQGGEGGEDTGGNTGGEDGGNTGGGNTGESPYDGEDTYDSTDDSNTDGSEYEITITVEATFYDCRAFDGISSKFSSLASDIEDFIEDITVTVECSELNCCVSDDYCSSFNYCDTDGDGVYDTYDTDGDGNNDETGVEVDSNDASHMQLTFGFAVFTLIMFVLTL